MPYPLERNPLEHFLSILNRLRQEAYDTQLQTMIEPLKASEIDAKISSHIKSCSIPSREFDVFMNKAELARLKFESENPQPTKPDSRNCLHNDVDIRTQIARDGRKNIVRQCQECGKHMGFVKKSDVENIDSLKEYNQHWNRAWENYNAWEKRRYQVYYDALNEGDELPSFDEEEFNNKYKKDNPPPFNSPCAHANTVITRRILNSSPQAVEQCEGCGKHVRSIPKKSVHNFDSIKEFDENLEESYFKETSKWLSEFYEKRKEANDEFIKDIKKDIRDGIYYLKTNNTFNTYYDSKEWMLTRERILERDEHKCQNKFCRNRAVHVHHIVYDRLGKENDYDLISLCPTCHDTVHKIQDDYKYQYRMTPSEIVNLGTYEFIAKM